MRETETARGEIGVASLLVLGGLLKHQYLGTTLIGGQRCTESGVPRTDDHDIVFHDSPSQFRYGFRPGAVSKTLSGCEDNVARKAAQNATLSAKSRAPHLPHRGL